MDAIKVLSDAPVEKVAHTYIIHTCIIAYIHPLIYVTTYIVYLWIVLPL